MVARLDRCQESQGNSIHMPRLFINRNTCFLPCGMVPGWHLPFLGQFVVF